MKNNLFTPNLHEIIVPGYRKNTINSIFEKETRNLSKLINYDQSKACFGLNARNNHYSSQKEKDLGLFSNKSED